MNQRANLDEETTDWRAVCGRTACTVRTGGATGDTSQANRGFQAWMDIRAGWNRLYFDEDASGGGSTDASVCTATVPVGFYRDGASLATALQTAMNGVGSCTSGSRSNTYTVTFRTDCSFQFARNGGTGYFRIRWSQTPSSIAGAVGRRGQGTTGWTSPGPTPAATGTTTITTSASYRLHYSGGSFTETVGGVADTYYQSVAARMWNGETIRLRIKGPGYRVEGIG